ncbi:TetR/AcrR family transcriptional regulator [Archangium violaceum]|uniref:TetR/AcrR family transcriptional regulator n=1 Tax=Archangium violaceum TaxID=83451 RepID=UPI0037BF0B79
MSNRGRPRGFDRDLALQRALEVFWAKGYEGAQVADLTSAMGINPPSFYAAFGSKEAAFREALELYLGTAGAGSMRALEEAETVQEAIEAMLRASVEIALAAPHAKGCLVVLGLVNCAPDNAPLGGHLTEMRHTTFKLIHQRIERGVREGDLPAHVNTQALAAFYCTVMQGLSLRARDGASREELLGTVTLSMGVLNGRTGVRRV